MLTTGRCKVKSFSQVVAGVTVICAQDILVERIYKDLQVSKIIREKVDHLFLPLLAEVSISHLNGSPAWVPSLVVL